MSNSHLWCCYSQFWPHQTSLPHCLPQWRTVHLGRWNCLWSGHRPVWLGRCWGGLGWREVTHNATGWTWWYWGGSLCRWPRTVGADRPNDCCPHRCWRYKHVTQCKLWLLRDLKRQLVNGVKDMEYYFTLTGHVGGNWLVNKKPLEYVAILAY